MPPGCKIGIYGRQKYDFLQKNEGFVKSVIFSQNYQPRGIKWGGQKVANLRKMRKKWTKKAFFEVKNGLFLAHLESILMPPGCKFVKI